jgi:hypothetical protein
MKKSKAKKQPKKLIGALIIGGLITLTIGISYFSSSTSNNYFPWQSQDTNLIERLPFQYPDGTLLFTLEIDKSYVMYQQLEFNSSESRQFLQWAPGSPTGGSVTHQFTYFTNESAMTSYFQGDGNLDYKLTYPLTDEALKHDRPYIYYHTTYPGTPESYSTGTFYDWDYPGTVKGLEASLITYYANYYDSNRDRPTFSDDSAPGNSYCVINLYQVDSSLTGYLVYSGQRSAGSNENFCEHLDNLNTFKIIPG